jgi:hypothetical protein
MIFCKLTFEETVIETTRRWPEREGLALEPKQALEKRA